MVAVTISDADYQLAVASGRERHSVMKHLPQQSLAVVYDDDEHLIQNIRSAAAEIAVARHLKSEWLGAHYGGATGYDVAPNIEVRTTRPGRPLFIKDREVQPGRYQKKPADNFVLVYQHDDDFNTYELVGFIRLDYGWQIADRYTKNGRILGWTIDPIKLWKMERLEKAVDDLRA